MLTIKRLTEAVQFTTTMRQNGSTIIATANMTIDRKKWNINHKPETTSWYFIAVLKDNLIDNEIPVMPELVFTKN